MRVREITVHRYRSISASPIPIGSLMTFVGGNGSGKSTLLRAIEFLLCGAHQGEIASINGRPALLQLLCQKGPPEVAAVVEVEISDVPELNEELKVKIGGHPGWKGGNLKVRRKFSPNSPTQCPLEFEFDESQRELLGSHMTKFSASVETRLKSFCAFIPAERVLGSDQHNQGVPYPRDGRTLMQRLHKLSVERTETLSDVVDDLERLFNSTFPEFTSLRVVQRNGLFDFEFNKKEKFNSAWMGSGHREILVMLGELLLSQGLIMIEEPERSLHPRVQRSVLSLLERAASGRQLMVCTHSPAVVSSAPFESLFRVSAPAVEQVTEKTISKVVADLGISFADSMNHRLLLLVEGDDDAAVWNAWFQTAGLSADCLAIDTRGFTNVGFYAESDFLSNLKVRPVVCASLDGDTKMKRQGPTAEAHATRVAKEFDGIFFTLQRECIDDYILSPQLLARAWGKGVGEIERAIDELGADWKTRHAKGKPIDVKSKWVLDRLYPTFANTDASPESIGHVARIMSLDDLPAETQALLAKMTSLARA